MINNKIFNKNDEVFDQNNKIFNKDDEIFDKNNKDFNKHDKTFNKNKKFFILIFWETSLLLSFSSHDT